jgi:hypothetical protein
MSHSKRCAAWPSRGRRREVTDKGAGGGIDRVCGRPAGTGDPVARTRRNLRRFVEFVEGQGAAFITTDLALRWAMTPKAVQRATWARRLSQVRGFATWLTAHDPRTQIPPARILAGQRRESTTVPLSSARDPRESQPSRHPSDRLPLSRERRSRSGRIGPTARAPLVGCSGLLGGLPSRQPGRKLP